MTLQFCSALRGVYCLSAHCFFVLVFFFTSHRFNDLSAISFFFLSAKSLYVNVDPSVLNV